MCDRRRWMRGGLTLCLWAATVWAAERPNVVVMIGDDIGWDDFGCYGHPTIRTPHVDALAQGGMRFDNAFLTASSCSPSRCSIIAGRYPHNTGAAELHTPLPAAIRTFPGELKRGGYYTAAAGKWHLGEACKRDFDRIEGGGRMTGNGGEANWLPVLRERPRDRPFFLWLASFDAHRPWGADGFGTPFDPNAVTLPPYLVDAPGTRRDLASYYNEVQRFDHYVGLVVAELERQGVLENTLIVILGDNGRPFPRCKTRVLDSGMQTALVVHWPAGIARPGTTCAGLVSVIDLAPTFLEVGGLPIADSFQGRSFAALLRDPSRPFRRYVFAEHNWHDYEAHERMVRSRDVLYLLNSRPLLANNGPADSVASPSHRDLRARRDAGFLNAAQADVFAVPRAREELFDVDADRDQLINVAALPRYAETLAAFRQVLAAWQADTHDNTPAHLTPDGFDRETGRLLPGIPRPSQMPRGEMPGVTSGGLTCTGRPGF